MPKNMIEQSHSRGARGGRHAVKYFLVALLLGIFFTWLGAAEPAHAAPDSCGLSVTIIAAPFAAVDSNRPGIDGPKTAMLGARIRNASSLPVNNASVSFRSSGLGLLSGSPSSYFLNDLAPGASVTAYWPVVYPATFDVGYSYTIAVANPDGCSASASSQIVTQSEISAAANKLLPTGSTKTVTPDVVTPGSLVTVRITGFTLGTVGQGPRGDYDAWLQPVGNLDFDPSCLRLVRSEVRLASISASPFVDQLYFTGLRNYRADATDYVAYTFIALRACATTIHPYQEAASGTQEKYNSDFDASTSLVSLNSGGSSTLLVTVQPSRTTANAGDLIRYSVTYSAPDAPVGYPANGNPVLIAANIPDQTTYLAGSATETAAADAEFSSDGGATWVTAEPAAPDAVTDLRWVLATAVDKAAGQVQYEVTVDESYNGAPLQATAGGGLSDGSVLASSSATVAKDAGNSAPAANDDNVKTNTDSAVTINVAANDIDMDGNLDLASAMTVTLPAHGALTNDGNGLFTYTPTAGYAGPDSFSYRICDSTAACDQATVMIFAGWEQLQWESGVVYVAFEDLKNVGWSDWDYNDFVVKIDIDKGVDSAGRLAAIEIEYDALARGAGYAQRFVHNLPIEGGGIAMISVYDYAGGLLTQRTAEFAANTSFTIFERTIDALPPMSGFFDTNTRNSQPGVVDGRTATLTVYLYEPDANPAIALPPIPWDPYVYVYYTQQEVHLLIPGHLDNTQIVNPVRDPSSPLVGYDLPLAQAFMPGWQWPEEFRGLWRGYPKYVDFVGSGGVTNPDWWQPQNADSAWLWSPGNGGMVRADIPAAAGADSLYFAGAVAADLDGDGWNEVIIGNLLSNQVEVYNALRQPVRGWPQTVGGGVKSAAAVADLDGDGFLDIVVGAADGMLYAWRHTGRPLPGWPVSLHAGFRVLATPAIGDIDGDGGLDVVVPLTDGKLYAVDAAGAAKTGWPVSIGDVEDLYGGQVLNSSPKLADLDGDGALEVVVGSTDKRVYAFSRDGSLRWSYPTGDLVLSTPAVGDIDPGVPGLETVIGSGDRYVYLLDVDGNVIWRRPTGWTVRSSPAIADLDGDQDLEILVGSDDDRVWAWHHTGAMVAGWPQTTGADVLSSPHIGDVDGDGQPDVVVGSDDARVWAWHADGTALAGWPHTTTLSVKGAPLLANLDDDPAPEVVAGDLSGALYYWNVDQVSFRLKAYLPLITATP